MITSPKMLAVSVKDILNVSAILRQPSSAINYKLHLHTGGTYEAITLTVRIRFLWACA